MGNNKLTKITLITIATVVSLFATIITVAPPQQVDSLSIYNPNAASPDPGSIAKPAPTTTLTLSSAPNVNCVMDKIESLESFLSCLGAK
jgi:hypothetical protein